jgi:hypothetical protein
MLCMVPVRAAVWYHVPRCVLNSRFCFGTAALHIAVTGICICCVAVLFYLAAYGTGCVLLPVRYRYR